MLSPRARTRLVIMTVCLLLFHVWISLGSSPASDPVIEEADTLIKRHRYGEAVELLEKTIEYRGGSAENELTRRLAYARKMYASDTAFMQAMDAYESGDYLRAYDLFRTVLPEDVKNFTEAREKICELNLSMSKLVKKQRSSDA